MILRTAVVLIALLVSPAARAEYMTYQKWSGMPETYRTAYIAGVHDSGLHGYDSDMTFILNEQPGKYSEHYYKCTQTSGMTDRQLAENVLNFAKSKPEYHTGSVLSALVAYLIAACGNPPKK